MRNLIDMITESTVHFSYEQNGFPHAMYDEADVLKAVAHRHITPDTIVTVYRGDDRSAAKASDVPEIAKHLKPAEPAAKKRTPIIHITHALDTIAHADLRSEQQAHEVFDAIHSICDTVHAYTAKKGEIALAVQKAVDEAFTYFPRDVHALMTNPNAMRNIKDGLKVIANELKHYGVIMEGRSTPTA